MRVIADTTRSFTPKQVVEREIQDRVLTSKEARKSGRNRGRARHLSLPTQNPAVIFSSKCGRLDPRSMRNSPNTPSVDAGKQTKAQETGDQLPPVRSPPSLTMNQQQRRYASQRVCRGSSTHSTCLSVPTTAFPFPSCPDRRRKHETFEVLRLSPFTKTATGLLNFPEKLPPTPDTGHSCSRVRARKTYDRSHILVGLLPPST